MKYIRPTQNESGAYSALQDRPAPGLLAFPEEFVAVFYPTDKDYAGFVTIEDDGHTVTSCVWNEEAYQKYITWLPETVPSAEEQIADLKAELASTDYQIIKCSEYQMAGLDAPYDIAKLHDQRQSLRDRINELECDAT